MCLLAAAWLLMPPSMPAFTAPSPIAVNARPALSAFGSPGAAAPRIARHGRRVDRDPPGHRKAAAAAAASAGLCSINCQPPPRFASTPPAGREGPHRRCGDSQSAAAAGRRGAPPLGLGDLLGRLGLDLHQLRGRAPRRSDLGLGRLLGRRDRGLDLDRGRLPGRVPSRLDLRAHRLGRDVAGRADALAGGLLIRAWAMPSVSAIRWRRRRASASSPRRRSGCG